MSERQAKATTLRALLPSRLVPEDMLSEWQGPNLPNTKNYAPSEDSIGGMIRKALLSGVAGVGGFTGLPMSDEGNRAALLGELLAAGMPLVGGVKQLAKLVRAENEVAQGIKAYHGSAEIARRGKLDKFQREISPTGSIRVPDENADAMGTWWSASKEDAKKFGKNFGPDGVLRDGAVVEGEIRFKNPKVFDDAEDYTAFIRKFKREDGMGGFKVPRSDDIRTALDGHDGIIIRGGGKGDRTPEGADYYLAFNNEDFDVKKVDLPDWSKPPSR